MIQAVHAISVILCAYTEERWDALVAAVESVRQQTLAACEIIIVIDHNPQFLQRVQAQLLNVIVVENTETRGLSGARNSGIAVASGDVVVFLDDDAVATADWLMSLCEAFSDPQVLGAGGPVLPLWLGQEPCWFPEEFHWVVGCTYRGLPQSSQCIRNPIGANMAFRREVFATVGGFRSAIGRVGRQPRGCEETELCIRAHQHWPQSRFLYQPQARVFHRVSGDRADWRYFCARCYGEGVSKAFIARYIGRKDSLASERVYLFRALPQGILRNVKDALFRHHLSGLARAGAIIVGVAVTTTGYLAGSISLCISWRQGRHKALSL